MELSCSGLHRGNKETKLICHVSSAKYRSMLLCSAYYSQEPNLTYGVAGKHFGSVKLCSAQG